MSEPLTTLEPSDETTLEQTYIELVKQKSEYQGGYEIVGDQGEMLAVHDPREQVYYLDYIITPSGLFAAQRPSYKPFDYISPADLVKNIGSKKFLDQANKSTDQGADVIVMDNVNLNGKFAMIERLDLTNEKTRLNMKGVFLAATEKAKKESKVAPTVNLTLADI